jgi:hypothetical protein
MFRADKNGDLQGQPQCRRKEIIVGFPFGLGNCSVGDVGAFESTSGAGNVSRAVGVLQEFNSCWNVIVGL